MGIIFPSSPTVGQTYTDAAGATWVWNGKQWTSALSSNIFLPITGGTMQGQINNLQTNDPPAGDSSQLVPNTEWIANNRPQNRNRLINGSFLVDQRNSGVSIIWGGNQNWAADRWLASASRVGILQSVVFSNSVGGNAVPTCNFLNIVVLSATTPAASEVFSISQTIEWANIGDLQWGTPIAKPVTLSFWIQVTIGGTYSGSVCNYDGSRSYPFTFTVPAVVWTYVTITIPGDTQGNWANLAGGTYVRFDFGCGANFRGPANVWGSANYIGATGAMSLVTQPGSGTNLANIQFELGTQATPFDLRAFSEELMLCQRYYQTGYFNYQGYTANGYQTGGSVEFKVTMFTRPTMNYVAAGSAMSGIGFPLFGVFTDSVNIYAVANVTGANGYQIRWTANAEL